MKEEPMDDYPAHYNWIMNRFEKIIAAHQEMGKTLHAAGPLDQKTGQLVQLAAAAAIRSEGAVHSHVKRALEAGASPEEIYHTLVLLTSTIGFPTTAAALSWASDLIEP
jgi:4-carboxymuconolactone decarboxylase